MTSEVKPETENLPTPLLAPAGGVPELIETKAALTSALKELAAGTGPIAVDAERASGYRYSARAYLIQLKRNSQIYLIDPIPFMNSETGSKLVRELNEILQSDEVILHASTQDLPCLREWGIHPKCLFDTELGARIAGLPRVGLGALVEHFFARSLAKEHSAVDWSLRPLNQDWIKEDNNKASEIINKYPDPLDPYTDIEKPNSIGNIYDYKDSKI